MKDQNIEAAAFRWARSYRRIMEELAEYAEPDGTAEQTRQRHVTAEACRAHEEAFYKLVERDVPAQALIGMAGLTEPPERPEPSLSSPEFIGYVSWIMNHCLPPEES